VHGRDVPRQTLPVMLLGSERQELQCWVNAHHTPQQISQRCQIILAAADEKQDRAIAADLGINFKTVALWRGRFRDEGVDCLWEVAAGRGRKRRYSEKKID
jgi:transposase